MMLQSTMSLWYLILALNLSSLFSMDWTLASTILGRCVRCAWVLNLFLMLARLPLGLLRVASASVAVVVVTQFRWTRLDQE